MNIETAALPTAEAPILAEKSVLVLRTPAYDIYETPKNEEGLRTLDLDKLIPVSTDEYGIIAQPTFAKVSLAVAFESRSGHVLHHFHAIGGWGPEYSYPMAESLEKVQGPVLFSFVKSVGVTAHKEDRTYAFLIRPGDRVTFLGVEWIATKANNDQLSWVKAA